MDAKTLERNDQRADFERSAAALRRPGAGLKTI
jgi:hypothetical protein